MPRRLSGSWSEGVTTTTPTPAKGWRVPCATDPAHHATPRERPKSKRRPAIFAKIDSTDDQATGRLVQRPFTTPQGEATSRASYVDLTSITLPWSSQWF